MTKSYADQCLDRAERATPGPWKNEPASQPWLRNRTNNAEFCRHARTDVPELARRLKKAIDALQKIGYWKSDVNVCCFPVECYALVDELEEMPAEKDEL